MPGATAIRRQAVAAPALPSTGREPAQHGAADAAAAGPRRLQQRQAVGARERGAEHAGHPPLDQIARELGELAGHGLERGAFHLAELDGEHLQQVPVGVDGRGAPAVGRAHQPARHVEPDRALARPGARGGVDRHHARRVEDAGGQRGQVAQSPGSERPVLAQRRERVGRARRSRRRSCAGRCSPAGSPREARASAWRDGDAQHLERERLEQQRAAQQLLRPMVLLGEGIAGHEHDAARPGGASGG